MYKWRKRTTNLSKYEHIEDIFEELKNLSHIPIRYSYSEIKKMTGNFKERLGTGGSGTVFKGKLRSGPAIAVKMMDKSMSSVQEFANLVASMAKIHHDSLLQLIGFCLKGEKQAFLVYDLMPNGSLQKYLNVSGEEDPLPLSSFSYQKMHRISLEVARGIDHLHQNLGIQTSHIGFKPHNVLLDENLNPKMSDFGLVKLYDPLECSSGSRDMAPEFYYKNIGEVSYKSDVYSYGILLMEMVGRIKNIAEQEVETPVHFPKWLFDQLKEGKDLEIRNSTAATEETKVLKKMMIVALWCIQMLPEKRPSMSKVVEMLQGYADELLQIPPNPFAALKMGLI